MRLLVRANDHITGTAQERANDQKQIRRLLLMRRLCRARTGPLSWCGPHQPSDSAQCLIRRARIRKEFRDIRIEENHVSAFRLPCRSNAAGRFGEIVFGPHGVFVRPQRTRLLFTFLHIVFAHAEPLAGH